MIKNLSVTKISIAILYCISIGILVLLVYLGITDTNTAKYVLDNHFKHYLVGMVFVVILLLLLQNRLNWEQRALYVVFPLLIAAGWPDIVYFISYLIDKGTYVGVLVHKNAVYYMMHKPLASLSAGPVIAGVLMWYDSRKDDSLSEKFWSWPIVILVLTALLSLSHIFLDRFFGF